MTPDLLLSEGPTGIDSEPISAQRLADADWSPIAYTGLLHFLLDGGMTALPAPAQILYLHLVREAYGRRRHPVRITLDQLHDRTGLSRSTIFDALRKLASPEVDLLNVVSPGGPKVPGLYEVRLASYRKSGVTVRRARRRRLPVTGSIETRLAELRPEDRADLQVLYDGLSKADRDALESDVRDKFEEIGYLPDSQTLRQGVLFALLRRDMYHRIRKTYPLWFTKS